MISINIPSIQKSTAFIQKQAPLDYTYSPLFGTKLKDNIETYDNDSLEIVIGKGVLDFEIAKKAIRSWTMFPALWTKILKENTPIEVNETVAMYAKFFGLWWRNACKIVYVTDNKTEFGFAYGTLPGHIESGEELFLVSMNEKEEVIYTIKAFAKVLKTCPNMHLTLVGERADSDYYDSIVALIAEEKLSDFVDIKDFVKSDFNAFLSQYDVFIHPSCYSDARDCEGGAPIVLLNAQSQGLPIISTTHCDIPSEVLHGQTGLLSPEKDVDSLAKNIGLFYTMDNVEYQWYSKNTIQHVENEYDIEKSAKVLAKIYKNISGV